MSEKKTYTGGCHCGRVRFEVNIDPSKATSCNCSICSKVGAMLAFVPADQFKLLAGEDELSDYQFAKMNIHHVFCRNCGIRSFARGTGPDGRGMCAVNVRCLEGIDLDAVTLARFDGRSL